MKKVPIIITALYVFIMVALILFFTVFSNLIYSTDASQTVDYSYTITNYSCVFEFEKDRNFKVTENITALFNEYGKHGIIRDLPLNSGEVYSDIKSDGVDYSVEQESADFLSIYFGDENTTIGYGESVNYNLTYRFKIPEGDDKDAFYINILGGGWATYIERFECKIILGSSPEKVTLSDIATQVSDGNEYTITASNITPFTPISFKAEFKAGTVAAFAPDGGEIAAMVIAIAVLIATALLAAFLPKRTPVPVVNFTPPDGIDPLLAGTMIDGSAGNKDVTAMIYYWASKNYIKIDFSDEKNPVFLLNQPLPESAPDYEKKLFYGLFKNKDRVEASAPSISFATASASAKKLVRKKVSSTFSKSSIIGAIAAAVIAAAVIIITLGVRCAGVNIDLITRNTMLQCSFATVFFFLILYLIGYYLRLNRFKFKRKYIILLFVLQLIIVGLYTAGIYFIIKQTFILSYVKIIMSLTLGATALISSAFLRLNKNYVKQIEPLLGFKQFITLVEKDRLEKLINDDPEYYYEVLPYAIVLGVSDIWNDKFKELEVQAPVWATGMAYDVFNYMIFYSLITRSVMNFTTTAVSKISTGSFSGGGFGGGGGGGFSGGGFGGGGGRSW